MKRMDEMERKIRMRSMQYGYIFFGFALCCWMVYDMMHGKQNFVATFILFAGFLVENTIYMYMRHKMVKDDDEYKESDMVNKVFTGLSILVMLIAVILIIGGWVNV